MDIINIYFLKLPLSLDTNNKDLDTSLCTRSPFHYLVSPVSLKLCHVQIQSCALHHQVQRPTLLLSHWTSATSNTHLTRQIAKAKMTKAISGIKTIHQPWSDYMDSVGRNENLIHHVFEIKSP